MYYICNKHLSHYVAFRHWTEKQDKQLKLNYFMKNTFIQPPAQSKSNGKDFQVKSRKMIQSVFHWMRPSSWFRALDQLRHHIEQSCLQISLAHFELDPQQIESNSNSNAGGQATVRHSRKSVSRRSKKVSERRKKWNPESQHSEHSVFYLRKAGLL